MLKWSATQTLVTEPSANITIKSSEMQSAKRRRRATIANKENIVTSTPVGRNKIHKTPLPLNDSLLDILSIEPQTVMKTPENVIPKQWASTLPKFEEEYSPSFLAPGKLLATRGLLPDTYTGNPRYFATPSLPHSNNKKSLPKKRKLELDFSDLECANPPKSDTTTISSTHMGDKTLDKLIDAILESASKDKKKKSRKSFNLRRKTLVKNTTENIELILSPSYTPAEDPASDLSFLGVKSLKAETSICAAKRRSSLGNLQSKSDCKKYFEIGLALPSIYV